MDLLLELGGPEEALGMRIVGPVQHVIASDASRELKAAARGAGSVCHFVMPYFFILLYKVTRLMPKSFAVFVRL